MTTISSVSSTGSASVDQSIAAAEAAIAASRAAYPTGGRVNSTITDNASDTLGSSAVAQLNRMNQGIISSNGKVGGFLPASYAPVIAKLSMEQMLIQDFMLVNLGSAPTSGLKALDVQVDPTQGGFELFL
jgi:hypothetical protein